MSGDQSECSRGDGMKYLAVIVLVCALAYGLIEAPWWVTALVLGAFLYCWASAQRGVVAHRRSHRARPQD